MCELDAEGKGLPGLPEGVALGADFAAFLGRCLRGDPAARPSAAELLRDPFVLRRDRHTRARAAAELPVDRSPNAPEH